MTATATLPTPHHVATPEQHLMAAVLNDALDVVAHRGGPRRRRLVRQTTGWFASDDTTWPFSFRNVCAALGADPVAIRAVVRHQGHHGRALRIAA